MKYLKFILLLTATQFILGCKKDKNLNVTQITSSLTVINAVPGSSPLATNFSTNYTLTSYYKNALRINYGTFSSSYEFGSHSGTTPLELYQYPDTLSSSTPLYKLSLNLGSGSIHTLFLTGLLSSPDTLFTTDHPRYHSSSDSTMGVRFVNLSPGSNPVSVDIQGKANGSEVSSLAYKGITGFKNYVTNSTVSSYTFEFKDAATGTLLGIFTMNGINNGTNGDTQDNAYRFRNFTIAFYDVPGNQNTFLINNY
ncbi:MAG: hypothetical protein JWR09_3218 [Mucilaginibacter sp.]|nr:hypothetical protein [Mucilaginibacter sp.]